LKSLTGQLNGGRNYRNCNQRRYSVLTDHYLLHEKADVDRKELGKVKTQINHEQQMRWELFITDSIQDITSLTRGIHTEQFFDRFDPIITILSSRFSIFMELFSAF
tara:strand:+ start:1077 stop:1394 length:318 start_codon:yes stop_codon:yes gene_type:complete